MFRVFEFFDVSSFRKKRIDMVRLKVLLLFLMPLLLLSGRPDGFSISEIDDATMARMEGRSFGKDCTTRRSDLRYLTVLHYDLEGRVRKGELVCNKAIAQDLIEIFQALYDARYPIEKMRLIDEYDGDDERSMADNNTSCFNFRKVSGTKSLSKHAYGRAIDINPLYNPYVRTVKGKQKVEPANATTWAKNRTKAHHKTIITADDLCVKLFKQHGFRWGGDWKRSKDYQHFDK